MSSTVEPDSEPKPGPRAEVGACATETSTRAHHGSAKVPLPAGPRGGGMLHALRTPVAPAAHATSAVTPRRLRGQRRCRGLWRFHGLRRSHGQRGLHALRRSHELKRLHGAAAIPSATTPWTAAAPGTEATTLSCSGSMDFGYPLGCAAPMGNGDSLDSGDSMDCGDPMVSGQKGRLREVAFSSRWLSTGCAPASKHRGVGSQALDAAGVRRSQMDWEQGWQGGGMLGRGSGKVRELRRWKTEGQMV